MTVAAAQGVPQSPIIQFWRLADIVVGFLLLGSPAVAVRQDKATVTERDVKAAFLCQFTRFVEWPLSARSPGAPPHRIGVLRDEGMADRLHALLAKGPKGRFEIVRAVHPGELADCHVAWIPRAADAAAAIRVLAGRPVLVVGETEGFAAAGGTVNLYLEGGRVKFEINPAAAERAGLKLSAKLLNLARIVRDKESP